MEYAKLDAALLGWQEAYRRIAETDTARPFGLQKAALATEAQILAAEKALGARIPPDLRAFFLQYSGQVEFFAFLCEPFQSKLPAALRGIFCASLFLGVKGMVDSEKRRRDWVQSCFSNPKDAYDRVWHNKFGFMQVDNGDVIALDLHSGSVVYLSHDDGEGHGCVLGRSFEVFLANYVAVGLCGEEDWQMLPFIPDAASGLCPDCENAVLYRELVRAAGTEAV